MELQNIGTTTTWNEATSRINSNNSKIGVEIDKLKNATYKNKGYFKTYDKLVEAFPSASLGSKAYVGENYPYAIYVWDGSSWEDSGVTGGEENVELSDYYTKEETREAVKQAYEVMSIEAYDALGEYEDKLYFCTEE